MILRIGNWIEQNRFWLLPLAAGAITFVVFAILITLDDWKGAGK